MQGVIADVYERMDPFIFDLDIKWLARSHFSNKVTVHVVAVPLIFRDKTFARFPGRIFLH